MIRFMFQKGHPVGCVDNGLKGVKLDICDRQIQGWLE